MRSILLVALLTIASVGQVQNMAVDESQIFRTAKKVAIFINIEPPAAAQYRPDFERAKQQISTKLAKQKLQLVQEPADADIVLVAREFNSDSGKIVTGTGTMCLGDEVKVYNGGKMPSETDAPIWSVSEVCGFSWPLNRAMDGLAKAMKK